MRTLLLLLSLLSMRGFAQLPGAQQALQVGHLPAGLYRVQCWGDGRPAVALPLVVRHHASGR